MRVSALASFLFVVKLQLAESLEDDSFWPTIGGSFARHGFRNLSFSRLASQGDVLQHEWKVDINSGGAYDVGWTSPVVADGRVYASCRPAGSNSYTRLVEVGQRSGKRLRHLDIDGIAAQPVLARIDSISFLFSVVDYSNHSIIGVHLNNLSIAWRTEVSNGSYGIAANIAASSRLKRVFAVLADRLVAVNALDGSVEFSTPLDVAWFLNAPWIAVAEGGDATSLFVGSYFDTYSIDPSSGSVIWHFKTPTCFGLSCPLSAFAIAPPSSESSVYRVDDAIITQRVNESHYALTALHITASKPPQIKWTVFNRYSGIDDLLPLIAVSDQIIFSACSFDKFCSYRRDDGIAVSTFQLVPDQPVQKVSCEM